MTEPSGKKTISIRLDSRVYANACDLADAEGRSFNNWANRVIEYAIVRERLKVPVPPVNGPTFYVNGQPTDLPYTVQAGDHTAVAIPVSDRPPSAEHPKELRPQTLGVPNETLRAHADHMEKSTGTRPDTVRRGDEEAPLPVELRSDGSIGPTLGDASKRYPVRPAKSERDVNPILKKGKK